MVYQVEDYQNILKLSCRALAFKSYKAFLKNKTSRTSFLSHFLHDFWRKYFLLYSITWLNFIGWLPLLCEILSDMCTVTVCSPGSDVINFEINLIFLIQALFTWPKRSKQIFRTRRSKSKEFKNKRMKVQFKRAFKSYFLPPKK